MNNENGGTENGGMESAGAENGGTESAGTENTGAGSTNLLVSAWKARNELYEELFGQYAYILPKGNNPPVQPEPGFKRNTAGTPNRDWSSAFDSDLSGQRVQVLAYKPNDVRPYWLYVTSGLSNPWFQESPSEVSGFGCELMVKSNRDDRWPIRLLRRMAYYILSYSGTLSPGVILNMETPIAKAKQLNNIFIWYADEAPDAWYQLPSGGFGVFCAVGITEDECRFAESVDEYGCWCIQQVLRQTGIGQVTNPHRASVMKQEDIGGILQSVRNYADNFRSLS